MTADPLVLHTRARLGQLRDILVDDLTSLRCVTGIAVFGSFATDRWDEWSDLDLFVACEDRDRSAERLVALINARVRVLCYSPLETDRRQDGRYWFRGHSPFHKRDISFHDEDDWRRVIREHELQGRPIRYLDCDGAKEMGEAPLFEWEHSAMQQAFFDALHRVHRYARAYVRTGRQREGLCCELAAMQVYIAEHCGRWRSGRSRSSRGSLHGRSETPVATVQEACGLTRKR